MAESASDKLVVYTAITKGYDRLLPVYDQDPDIAFVCFADESFRVDGWDVRPFVNKIEHRVRRSRHPKINPHLYFPDHDVSIWMDGFFAIKGNLRLFADNYLGQDAITMFRHRVRNTLWEEAREIVRMGFPNSDLVMRQVQHYYDEGYRDENPLPHCAIMLRRHHDPLVQQTMELWWKELEKWHHRDQHVFPYVAWKTGLKPRMEKLQLADNDYFVRLQYHASTAQLDPPRIY